MECNEGGSKYALPSNKVIIGYAGSMGITNNLDVFVDCICDEKSRKYTFCSSWKWRSEGKVSI